MSTDWERALDALDAQLARTADGLGADDWDADVTPVALPAGAVPAHLRGRAEAVLVRLDEVGEALRAELTTARGALDELRTRRTAGRGYHRAGAPHAD